MPLAKKFGLPLLFDVFAVMVLDMKRHTFLSTAAGVIAALAISTSAAASPNSSVDADFDAVRDPVGVGISGALGTPDSQSAGYMYFRVEGEVVRVICLQPGVDNPSDRRVAFKTDSYANLRVGDASRLGSVAWFLQHQTYGLDGHPTGNAIGTPITGRDGIPARQVTHAEAATAQIAIWNYVHGVDYSTVKSERAKARVSDFLAHLSNPDNRVAEGAHDFELAATLTDGNLMVSTVGVIGSGKAPLASIPVTIRSTSTDLDPVADGVQTELAARSDATGNVKVVGVPASATDVTVTANFILPAGTVLTDVAGDAQQGMTVDPAPITRTVTATTPVVDTPPADTPLPHTGGSITWIALLLSGLAGALGFTTLRRRGI